MNSIKKLVLGILSFLLIFIIDLRAENNFILWKVTTDNATIYLAPTIHVLPKDFYSLNEKVDKIMKSSDYLVVELDALSDETLKIIKNDGMKYMYNTGNKIIKELVSNEKYNELKDKMYSIGLDLNRLNMFNPGVLNTVAAQMIMMFDGYSIDSGLDLYFIKIAKEMKKPILELESPLFQLEKLFTMEFDLQLEGLDETLSEQGKKDVIKAIKDFTNYVKNGDLEEFEKKFLESMSKDERLKEYYKTVFDERNIGMVNKIEGFMKNGGTYFIAVGGGHYVGKNNIRELLDKKGYKVERVKF